MVVGPGYPCGDEEGQAPCAAKVPGCSHCAHCGGWGALGYLHSGGRGEPRGSFWHVWVCGPHGSLLPGSWTALPGILCAVILLTSSNARPMNKYPCYVKHIKMYPALLFLYTFLFFSLSYIQVIREKVRKHGAMNASSVRPKLTQKRYKGKTKGALGPITN